MYHVTEKNENDNVECEIVPCSLTEHGKFTDKAMIVLFNPGSTSSYIKRSVLPAQGCDTYVTPRGTQGETTLGGETMRNLSVRAQKITLPEFSRSLQVDQHAFWWVLDNEDVRHHNAIIGRDLLRELKLGTMKMEGQVLLMKKRGETPTFYIETTRITRTTHTPWK